ncbi:F0F1 ATP synthase subunit delta [Hydrogenivirga sp.]
MEFNPLTYIFEIVNFFVLLWILKRLLYNPVISVLQRRKELIEERLKRAEEAEKEVEKLRREREELLSRIEEVKRSKLAEITREVEEEKRRLYERMKEELDAERRKFLESLEMEKEEVLREVREETLRTALAFTSKLLSSFADEELHRKLLSLALESVDKLRDDETLRKELATNRVVLVETAYPLSREDIDRVREKLKDAFGVEADLRVEVKKDLLAGVRIHLAPKIVDASLEGQLRVFEDLMRERIESEG